MRTKKAIEPISAPLGYSLPRLSRRRPRIYEEWSALRRWGRLPAEEALVVGYLLREAREAAGLNQSELAARLGSTQQAVSQAERWTSNPTIELVRNPDILAGLVEARGEDASPVIVGFAAETGDAEGTVLDHGRAKLERKGCDLLVVNEVGVDKTFGRDDNTVHILRQGSNHVVDAGPASKEVVAAAVWDAVQEIL